MQIIFQDRAFSPDSCAVFEECVLGTGVRRLLRFSVYVLNQGTDDLYLVDPATRPDLFVCACFLACWLALPACSLLARARTTVAKSDTRSFGSLGRCGAAATLISIMRTSRSTR